MIQGLGRHGEGGRTTRRATSGVAVSVAAAAALVRMVALLLFLVCGGSGYDDDVVGPLAVVGNQTVDADGADFDPRAPIGKTVTDSGSIRSS
jgi:hypothetical protein